VEEEELASIGNDAYWIQGVLSISSLQCAFKGVSKQGFSSFWVYLLLIRWKLFWWDRYFFSKDCNGLKYVLFVDKFV
jgi:hypothetical protein